MQRRRLSHVYYRVYYKNVCSKTYFTFDASILRRVGDGTKRTDWRSSTGRIGRIRGASRSGWDYDAVWEYVNTAGRHVNTDFP